MGLYLVTKCSQLLFVTVISLSNRIFLELPVEFLTNGAKYTRTPTHAPSHTYAHTRPRCTYIYLCLIACLRPFARAIIAYKHLIYANLQLTLNERLRRRTF